MAQFNKGRTVAIAIITVNAVISVLLIMAVVYLFFQVSHLQEENKNLRNKWQRLQGIHENIKKPTTEVNTVIIYSKPKVTFCQCIVLHGYKVAFNNTM